AFIQYGSDGILDPIALSDCARYCQTRSVRRPIGIIDVLENFARRTSRERHTRQCGRQVRTQQDGHLSGGADGKNSALGKIERPRLATAGTHREYGGRLVAPLRAEEHGLSIRRKSRSGYVAAAISQPLKGWLR